MADGATPVVLLRNQANTLLVGARVELLGVFDMAETPYHEKARPLDFKDLPLTHEDVVLIRFRLRGRVSDLTIVMDYGTSATHRQFYAAHHTLPPRSAALIHQGPVAPGEHEVRWDGRDSTADKRIVLAGVYTLRVIAKTAAGDFQAQTEIEIAPPRAWHFALNTRRTVMRRHKDGSRRPELDVEDSTTEVGYAQSTLKQLKFNSELSTTSSARSALERMRHSAVTYLGGHSSPIGLVFENAPDKSQSSWLGLVMLQGKNAPMGIDTVSLKELPDDAFRDVFLVVLAGCRAGNPAYAPQLRLRNLARKMDPKQTNGVMSPDTQLAIDSYQRWKGLPRTRAIDATLLQALGLDPSAPPGSATTIRSVQTSLSILSDMLQPDLDHKGEPTGVWNVGSSLAAITYQNNMNLEPTGIADPPTLSALGMGAEDSYQESVAQTILDKGAEVVVAFEETTFFDAMEQWSREFWRRLAKNNTIREAAKGATDIVVLKKGEKMPKPWVFSASGGDVRLLPVRYGRYRQP